MGCDIPAIPGARDLVRLWQARASKELQRACAGDAQLHRFRFSKPFSRRPRGSLAAETPMHRWLALSSCTSDVGTLSVGEYHSSATGLRLTLERFSVQYLATSACRRRRAHALKRDGLKDGVTLAKVEAHGLKCPSDGQRRQTQISWPRASVFRLAHTGLRMLQRQFSVCRRCRTSTWPGGADALIRHRVLSHRMELLAIAARRFLRASGPGPVTG